MSTCFTLFLNYVNSPQSHVSSHAQLLQYKIISYPLQNRHHVDDDFWWFKISCNARFEQIMVVKCVCYDDITKFGCVQFDGRLVSLWTNTIIDTINWYCSCTWFHWFVIIRRVLSRITSLSFVELFCIFSWNSLKNNLWH